MVHLPNIFPSIARRARSSDSSFETPRPNLVFRKAKILGKSVEELQSSNVPVPKFRGDAVFGIYPVCEALATGKRTFFALYMKDSVRSRSKDDQRISAILDRARILGLPVKRLTHSQFDKITDFQLHNGICLDASPLALAREVSSKHLTSIYLDNVLDPGNLGAIARSATFFGCYQIAFSEGREPSRITPAMSKASCGALESFRVARVPSFAHFHESLKSAGASFIGTSDASSAPRYGKTLIELKDLHVRPEEKIVVVLGDEGAGISEEVVNSCDALVTISSTNTRRTGVNSLNVSVVAGKPTLELVLGQYSHIKLSYLSSK